jgi:hypothetical protein
LTHIAPLQSLVLAIRQAGRCEDVVIWEGFEKQAITAKADPASLDRDGLWAVQTYAGAVCEYLSAYNEMREGRYYEGWCQLERVEIALHWIALNPIEASITAMAADLATTVELWQSIFPYRIFASPSFRYKDWKCSICGLKGTPVSPCGHTIGKVYDGELCTRTITDLEMLEISLVRHPVQKYSVMTPDDSEHDFSAVDYVLSLIPGPFHGWTGTWTHKRHDHRHFSEHAPEAPCPCESKLRYGECCLLEGGVRLRHFAMQIEGPMPEAYNEVILRGGLRKKTSDGA